MTQWQMSKTAQLLFIQGVSAKFEVTEELAQSAQNNYRWEYFQRHWENTNSLQLEVEHAKMC